MQAEISSDGRGLPEIRMFVCPSCDTPSHFSAKSYRTIHREWSNAPKWAIKKRPPTRIENSPRAQVQDTRFQNLVHPRDQANGCLSSRPGFWPLLEEGLPLSACQNGLPRDPPRTRSIA